MNSKVPVKVKLTAEELQHMHGQKVWVEANFCNGEPLEADWHTVDVAKNHLVDKGGLYWLLDSDNVSCYKVGPTNGNI